MNIFITGMHDFVGSNFVAYLSHEHIVYGLDIVVPKRKVLERHFRGTTLPQEWSRMLDSIIHMAGKAHDTKNEPAFDRVEGTKM